MNITKGLPTRIVFTRGVP